jgi:hypothetical protein
MLAERRPNNFNLPETSCSGPLYLRRVANWEKGVVCIVGCRGRDDEPDSDEHGLA